MCVAHIHQASGRTFYHHTQSGRSQWEWPASTSDPPSAQHAGPAEPQLPAAPEAALPSANPSAQHAQPAQHTDLAEQPLSAAPETDQPVSTATPSAPSVSQQRLHSPNASAADESHASGVCLAASPAATPAEPACRRRPKTRGGRRAHAPTSN